jgi:NTP pyrophosphatase (non-canonical NTP hydrolase)
MKSNTEQEFNKMVSNLVKSGDDILTELTPEQAHLLHMAVGVSGESGELLDAIKKHTVYQKELDLVNVIEEIGDIYFYLQGLEAALGLTREEILRRNIVKLNERYSEGSYSNEQAKMRADKQ